MGAGAEDEAEKDVITAVSTPGAYCEVKVNVAWFDVPLRGPVPGLFDLGVRLATDKDRSSGEVEPK